MKKILFLILLLAVAGFGSLSYARSCFEAPTRDSLVKKDTMNLAILVVDFTTYKFEKGIVLYYTLCEDCDKDSLPFKIDYKQPGDFGEIKFSYTGNGQTVFHATIVWDGTGSIVYPAEFIKADKFAYQEQVIKKPDHAQYFDRTLTPYIYPVEKYRAMADSAWQSVDSLQIIKEFSTGPMRVGFYAWPPSVGMFCPVCAKWIIFLYSGHDFSQVVPEFKTGMDISIYPVPARNELFIDQGPLSPANSAIRLFNSAGMLVHAQDAARGNIIRIDLSGFENGFYYVDIRNVTGMVRKKILVIGD